MVIIFCSYANEDFKMFEIDEITKYLENKPGINRVFYWGRDSTGSIVEFMNQKLPTSDSCIFFYSEHTEKSTAVRRERDMAIYHNKHIIPIYKDIEDVPPVIRIETGVNCKFRTPEEVAEQIYRLIILRFGAPALDPEEREPSGEIMEQVNFRGVTIPLEEVLILRECEKAINKKLPVVKNVYWNTVGFQVDNERVTGLGLYDCGLHSLPSAIGKLHKLKYLRISRNNLESLPDSIGALTELVIIDFSNNQLTTVPESIGNFVSALKLRLNGNKLSSIPATINGLKTLEELWLYRNEITSIPDAIGNLSNLLYFRVNNNHLKTIPDTIGQLTNLEIFNISNNKIVELPFSISRLISLFELQVDKFTVNYSDQSKNVIDELKNRGCTVVEL